MSWICKLAGHDFKHDPPILYCRRCGKFKHNPTSIPPAVAPNVPGWVLIDSYEDADTGTAFDYDSGVLKDIYDRYRLFLSIHNTSGDIIGAHTRVNNDSSANYDYTQEDGTTTTGVDNWPSGAVRADSVFNSIYDLWGRDPSGAGVSKYPEICTYEGSGYGGGALALGKLAVVYENVDQIRFWMDGNSVGVLKLFGFNY